MGGLTGAADFQAGNAEAWQVHAATRQASF